MERKFGWKRQLPDFRDINFMHLSGIELVAKKDLPPVVDWRKLCPAVYDQGNLGSCTANAIAGLVEINCIKQHRVPVWVPSRLFIYYNERFMEDTVESDSGAMIRDGIKSLNLYGYASENVWPYVESKFAVRAPDHIYADALLNRVAVKDYGSVPQDMYDMKVALASGYPIVIGFVVYKSFMSPEVARTGIARMPEAHEPAMGGHAVLIVGYNKQGWIVRNSWGENWGMGGYFIMPYEYFTNPRLAGDLWIVRLV